MNSGVLDGDNVVAKLGSVDTTYLNIYVVKYVACQMPLYPMIDNLDTITSKDNHGKVWNTKRNHFGWKVYLRKDAKKEDVDPYASPVRQKKLFLFTTSLYFCW